MDFEENFYGGYVLQLKRILSENSPKRDDDSYPHAIKRHGVVVSPFPGNLKTNGNRIEQTESGYTLEHGFRPAPYALYADKTSRKPQYIEKSVEAFVAYCHALGWEVEKI